MNNSINWPILQCTPQWPIQMLQYIPQGIQTLQYAPQGQIQIIGTVTIGTQPGCYTLTADNGTVYELKGFVLTDTSFSARVNVTGILRSDIPSTCGGISLEVISISRVQQPTPTPYYPPSPAPYPVPYPVPVPVSQRFSCRNGQCIPNPFGEFGSEFECRRSCGLIPPTQRFSCVNGNQCIPNPVGEFGSEGECRRSCGLIPPTQRYSCRSGQCIPNPMGEFDSFSDCRRSCGLITPGIPGMPVSTPISPIMPFPVTPQGFTQPTGRQNQFGFMSYR